MKIATITLHDTDNCGSSLQAYALQRFLLDNGYDNELIDYIPSYTRNNGNALKTFLLKMLYWKEYTNRRKKFKSFVQSHLRLTSRTYRSEKALRMNPPEADVYITGSDQLWNDRYLCGQDQAFYLRFVENKRKMSYAVSMGREKIPQENLDRVKAWAQAFEWISVREGSSISQIKTVLPDVSMDFVCDPVLLNEATAYDNIRVPQMIEGPYILVYLAQAIDEKFLESVVVKTRRRYKGKVVLIGTYRNKCSCDIHLRDVAPGEFLSLIYNAECIVSNSFHATMFSLIYSKRFLTILPPENSARMKEILHVAGLNNQTISSGKDWDAKLDQNINYDEVQDRLGKFRRYSGDLLVKKLNKE